jgi:Mg2+ and Co2+ transporter CorA
MISDTSDIDLILVDAMPSLDRHPFPLWEPLRADPFQSTLGIKIGPAHLRLPIMLEPRDGEKDNVRTYRDDSTGCMKTIVSRLLRSHTGQSILSPEAMPEHPNNVKKGDQVILSLLLAESAWQSAVSYSEGLIQTTHCIAIRATDDKVFKMFGIVRRHVADARMLLAELRHCCELMVGRVDRWTVKRTSTQADNFWSTEPVPLGLWYARSKDIRTLFSSMDRLESRLVAMSQAVNEDIQVVIGAVQVEDAKIMKRQSEWGVVLTVLAAIYLPMTLVTGIFGMNIKETNTDASRPDKWAVYATWGAFFGGTAGFILLYIAVR